MVETNLHSLMMYNERILHKGELNAKEIDDRDLDLKILKEKLFFNKTFIKNIRAIMMAFSNDVINNEFEYFTKLVEKYITNVHGIIHNFNIHQSGIYKKMNSPANRIKTFQALQDSLFSSNIDNLALEPMSSSLYYVISGQNIEHTQFVRLDPNHPLYSYTLEYNIDGDDFCKIDYQIASCLAVEHGVQRCELTTDANGKIIMIEFAMSSNQHLDAMRAIFARIPEQFISKNVVFVNNQYIYTDDIDQMLEYKIPAAELKPVSKYTLKQLRTEEEHLFIHPEDNFNILECIRDGIPENKIKSLYLTVYRIGTDSLLYDTIKKAVDNDIPVYVNIETEADHTCAFWAKELAALGVTVGKCPMTKCHAKMLTLQFLNGNCLSYIGSDNFANTESNYEEIGVTTTSAYDFLNISNTVKVLCQNGIGSYPLDHYNGDLWINPYTPVRKRFKYLVEEQMQLEEKGYICIKANAIADEYILSLLEKAAIKGVHIDLIIRGICAWVPDPEYIGKNVMIKSVVGNNLEHSRIYMFGRTDPDIYIGSLDPVAHKIDRKTDAMIAIDSRENAERVCQYIQSYINRKEDAWVMQPDGTYEEVSDGIRTDEDNVVES